MDDVKGVAMRWARGVVVVVALLFAGCSRQPRTVIGTGKVVSRDITYRSRESSLTIEVNGKRLVFYHGDSSNVVRAHVVGDRVTVFSDGTIQLADSQE